MVRFGPTIRKSFIFVPDNWRMPGSAAEISPLVTDESRREERTHLFVAASLTSSGGSCPVHIRNISPTGALVEGGQLPEQGSSGRLRRGNLEASVRVIWKAGRKAGLAFSTTIHVADWMPRTTGAHQRRVDKLVREIRSGHDTQPYPADRQPGAALEAELQAIRNELGELERGLLADVIVAATHPEIQLLDIALQRVERMLGIVGGS